MTNSKETGADASKTKRGTIVGKEGRSIAVRYGASAVDVLLIRPCDFHGVASLDEGAEVELRYTDHGAAGAWWHAFPVPVIDREVGSPSRGWHSCRRRANHKSQSERVPYMTLHWCDAHATCSTCNFAPSDDCPREHCPNRDDTPWCHLCGAMQKAKCQCPPRAEND